MSDWPPYLGPCHWHPAIATRHLLLGPSSIAFGGVASATWPTANLAIYTPILIPAPMVVAQLWVMNGSTASGNLNLGLYDIAGTRLVSSGSTAQSGTSAVQLANVTDTLVGAGVYYIALAMDGTTGTAFRYAPPTAGLCACIGMAQQASSFSLPSTATFASAANAYVPFVGITDRSTM